MTTTNGTGRCGLAHTRNGRARSFLNLAAVADFIQSTNPPALLLVCSGTFDQAAYEDVLGAGALCNLIWPKYNNGTVTDSALIAWGLFRSEKEGIFAAVARSRNGRRLLSRPEFAEDVPFCVQRTSSISTPRWAKMAGLGCEPQIKRALGKQKGRPSAALGQG